ncbi:MULTISPECIES: replication initiation factor domain-containing protein [Lactococcus]|uniref:replication initiation factor domain-containing protein n=1 Tax=Lactococcus TaxID=1357 RepID=UPI00203B927C|nr:MULTISPECIES: replication initiation factor domain-containing protein [Lactococcus]
MCRGFSHKFVDAPCIQERASLLDRQLPSVNQGGTWRIILKKGFTLYIGSRKSLLFFRFYEKDFERAEAMRLPVEIINDNLTVYSDAEGHLDEEWFDLMGSRNVYYFKMNPKPKNVENIWFWAMNSALPTMKFLSMLDATRYQELFEESEIPKKHQILS